jgi:hypothetical protein
MDERHGAICHSVRNAFSGVSADPGKRIPPITEASYTNLRIIPTLATYPNPAHRQLLAKMEQLLPRWP